MRVGALLGLVDAPGVTGLTMRMIGVNDCSGPCAGPLTHFPILQLNAVILRFVDRIFQ
jgi:hypothetical protein